MDKIISELIDSGYTDSEIVEAITFDLENKDVMLTNTYGRAGISSLKVRKSIVRDIIGKEFNDSEVKYSVHVNAKQRKNKINFALKIDKKGNKSARKGKSFNPDDYITFSINEVKNAINKQNKDKASQLGFQQTKLNDLYRAFEYDENIKYEVKDNVIYVEVKYGIKESYKETFEKSKKLKKGEILEYCDSCGKDFPDTKVKQIDDGCHHFKLCLKCLKKYY